MRARLAWIFPLLLIACSDDGGGGTDGGPPRDGPRTDGPRTDGPQTDGPQTDGPRMDGPVTATDGPKPDAPKSVLPPPPAGAVSLRISVDDSTDRAYASGELVLKGAFSFNATTNVITPDSGWAGPFVPLYDDGPGGLEGPGSVAGDNKHGALVYIVPGGQLTLEYGVLSPAGWMWPDGPNKTVTVKPGDTLVDLASFKIPARAGVDVTWVVDGAKLNNRTVSPGHEMVVVRANATHWSPLPCNDEGQAGDATKGDGRYTCRISAHIGKGKLFPHLGLPSPGDKVRFYVDIGGSGYHDTAGLSVTLASGTTSISKSGSDLVLSIPSSSAAAPAPAPDSSPLPAGLRGDLPGGQLDLPATGIKGHYYVPGSYDAHRKTPLLVALHGAYEQGIWMVNVWKTLAEDRGFLLLAPSSSATSWDLSAVFAGQTPVEDKPIRDAVSWLQQRYNVDAARVGVEGFSDGASMTLYMGLTHGALFNVAMANSPGGMGKNYPLPDKPAIYITHGDADTVLPVANARWMKDTLTAAGYKVEYHEFPGVGHVFPTDHKIPMLRYLESN